MGWLQKIFYGVDLDAEQARSDQLDAALRVQNEIDYGPGGPVYNQIASERGTAAANAAYQQVTQRGAADDMPDIAGDVHGAFREGLHEGYENVTGGIRATLAAPFKFTWASLPWQLLLAGAIFAFFYFGGPQLVKPLIRKYLK